MEEVYDTNNKSRSMQMPSDRDLIESLTILNDISETLNRAVDVRTVLESALAQLVDLMGLDTGWIFLNDVEHSEQWSGKGYILAAAYHLPPALALNDDAVWHVGCDCQSLCTRRKLSIGHNAVRCSRLARANGDCRGLAVHASAPLYSGERMLGILNVAATDWGSFTIEALALLTHVGGQIGVALERARLFDLLNEQRLHEQTALLGLSCQLLHRLDLQDLMTYLVEETCKLFQADACALLLSGDTPGYLIVGAATGWRSNPRAEQRQVLISASIESNLNIPAYQPYAAEDIEQAGAELWMFDLLHEEGFRGHAVAPLLGEERFIGALMVDTREPRHFELSQLRFLNLIANQAAIAIETARLQEEKIQRHRLEEEITVGKQIQLSMLPKACPEAPGWDFAAMYQPARIVGGDFYDFFELSDHQIGMVIADVADKGVPAAIFMALSRTMIRTTAMRTSEPAAALMQANRLILTDSQSDLFLSAFYAVLDTRTGRLAYANAGHNRPILFRATSGHIQDVPGQGIVLGTFENIILQDYQLWIVPGDVLIFYTDGVTEAMNLDNVPFENRRLRSVLASNATKSAQAIMSTILDAMHTFVGKAPQSDDITLFVVKRLNVVQPIPTSAISPA